MRDARPTVVPSVRRKSTTGLTITAAEVVGGGRLSDRKSAGRAWRPEAWTRRITQAVETII